MEQIELFYNFVSNKYFILFCGVLTFLLPLFLRLRIVIEEILVLRKKRKILNGTKPHWMLNHISTEWKAVNVYTNILCNLELFEEDGTVNYQYNLCEHKISLTQYNHLIELYNRSLFSGFWSLFLPYFKKDKSECKFYSGKNIFVKKIEPELWRYFMFTIPSQEL